MKKYIYILALLLIPAIGTSQKIEKKDAKEIKTERPSNAKNGKNKAALLQQLTVVKKAIMDCDDPKVDCILFDKFAIKIAKQPMDVQVQAILSSGFGSNFMTEMAKFEKMLINTQALPHGEVQSIFKKSPSYQLSFVNTRIQMEENRMEMVYDDDDDE
ncbi:hypothetical protein [Rasiella sp. SM2506]|uniref:hypothetical protein n=1 Tax=Rasiella sp. SM2506 TaxID=3423914 RepID=UPI003D7B61BA